MNSALRGRKEKSITMSYKESRKALGLSRGTLSNLAKLVGIRLSPASIKKLEDEGEAAVGSRGLSDSSVAYLNYVLGIGEFEAADWSSVSAGAPVVVNGLKGTHSFVSADGESVSVFSNGTVQSVSSKDARPAAPTGTPSAANAHLFEKRSRGEGGVYSRQILNYVAARADQPHGVGAIAVALGLDNGVVSRTVASLIKAGKLNKAGRGVVTFASGAEEAPAASENTEGDVPSF